MRSIQLVDLLDELGPDLSELGLALAIDLDQAEKIVQIAFQHRHVVAHKRQRVVDLVGDARDEMSQAGHLFSLDQPALGVLECLVGLVLRRCQLLERRCQLLEHHVLLPELLLGADPRGHVPENTLDADRLAVVREERRLHHLDIENLPLGRDVLFDDVKHLSTLDDPAIVAAVFLGEVAGPEIKIGLAQNLIEATAQLVAKPLVREGEPAIEILAQDVLRQGLDERVVEDLGLAQGLDGPAPLGGDGLQVDGEVAMALPQSPECDPGGGGDDDQTGRRDIPPVQLGRPGSGERQECDRVGKAKQ